MLKCFSPCIFYHQIQDKSQKPSMIIICDYKECQEIRNIPINEIEKCQHFKTYNEIKENNKKFYQINP